MAHFDHGERKLLEEEGLVLGIELDKLHGVRGVQEGGIGVKYRCLCQHILEVGIVKEVLCDEI